MTDATATSTPTPTAPLAERGMRPDATMLLTCFLVVLLAVPSALVVGALGTAGAPATIMALGGFAWWTWFHLHRTARFAVPQRVRVSVLVLLAVVLAAYAHAMATPLPVEEMTPADSGLLKMLALAGIVLVACDGIETRDHHHRLIGRLVIGAGAIAALGVVQNFTGQLWVNRISIPGLSGGLSEWTLTARGALARPSGTSIHPIEYGVVLTMVLPLAVTMARRSPRHRRLYQVALVAISFSIFLAVSRSAVICAAVGLLVLSAGWTSRERLRALGGLVLVAATVYVTVPGLLSTLASLFLGASDDASIASRTGSYEIAWGFIEKSPVLGRGFGTFVPGYWILDNQYLLLTIETGVLGLLAVLALFGCAASAARTSAARAVDDTDREICRALFASVCAGSVGFAFFDTMAFPQSACILFLVIGLSGAALRIHTDGPTSSPNRSRRSPEEADACSP
jgi:O-antigen ligase